MGALHFGAHTLVVTTAIRAASQIYFLCIEWCCTVEIFFFAALFSQGHLAKMLKIIDLHLKII